MMKVALSYCIEIINNIASENNKLYFPVLNSWRLQEVVGTRSQIASIINSTVLFPLQ